MLFSVQAACIDLRTVNVIIVLLQGLEGLYMVFGFASSC